MKNLLKELTEEAQELIDFGDSKEKAMGRGMMRVIDALKSIGTKEIDRKVKVAGHFLCSDTEHTIAEQIKLIREHEDQTDLIDYVEGVTVWEKVEFSFTCKGFLELID